MIHQLNIGLRSFSMVAIWSVPLSRLVFRMVFFWRLPRAAPSAGHVIGLIVPANSANFVPSGLGLRRERMFILIRFVFVPLWFLLVFCVLFCFVFHPSS